MAVSVLLSSFYRLLSPDPQFLRQPQSDMQGLVEEHTELSRRKDELMTAKDADLVAIRDLDAQCNDYKRKYELAKTELRGLKGSCLPASIKDLFC